MDESDRAACGRRKLDRGLAFGPVFCFVDKEQCGVAAGSRPTREPRVDLRRRLLIRESTSAVRLLIDASMANTVGRGLPLRREGSRLGAGRAQRVQFAQNQERWATLPLGRIGPAVRGWGVGGRPARN
jgi:hypothetical protein